MKVLVVAPHADDESLGVGGTIARHVSFGDEVVVVVMTGHGAHPHPIWPQSAWDVVRAEARAAMDVLGVKELLFREIPAACVAEVPAYQLNQEVFSVVDQVKPDILYVPFLWDLHKDHREIFYALSVAWRTCSPVGRGIREIYAYETLSETHWNTPYVEPGFVPNVYVDISQFLEIKIAALECYKSQMSPAPAARSLAAIRAQAVWRGALVNLPAAEAFVLVRKLIVS